MWINLAKLAGKKQERSASLDQYQHAVLRYDNLLLFGGDRRVLDGNAVPHAYSDMFSEIADAATQCGCTFTLYVDDACHDYGRWQLHDEGILEVHDSAVFHPSFVPDGRCCSDFPDGIMRQSYEK